MSDQTAHGVKYEAAYASLEGTLAGHWHKIICACGKHVEVGPRSTADEAQAEVRRLVQDHRTSLN